MTYKEFAVKISVFAAALSPIWLTVSCDEFCEEPNRAAIVVNFYEFANETTAKTMQKLSVKGVGNDSVLYKNANLSSVLFPLNPGTDITGLVIINDTIAVDTLFVEYSRRNRVVSSECGCATEATVTRIQRTDHSIRKVTITNPNITTVSYRDKVVNAENIRIYY